MYLIDTETPQMFNPLICDVSRFKLRQSTGRPIGRARELPCHKFVLVCINRTASRVNMSVHRETLGPLPALRGTHRTVQKRGDFLPGIEPIGTSALMGKRKLIARPSCWRSGKGSRSGEPAPVASGREVRSHKISGPSCKLEKVIRVQISYLLYIAKYTWPSSTLLTFQARC